MIMYVVMAYVIQQKVINFYIVDDSSAYANYNGAIYIDYAIGVVPRKTFLLLAYCKVSR